ncbi:Uncharacterised protein [uncultured archaeon]|nr:Uncharacterised protein [uncultured archaeon]
MRKIVVIVALVLIALGGESFAAPKAKTSQKYLTAQETMKILQDMGMTQGNPVTFVKSAETASKEWRVHLFSIQQGDAFMPLLTYVNRNDVVVGILIRDGKIVMPKIPINEMQPSMNMGKVKLSTENRTVFNTVGKEVLYMFADNSPLSRSIEQRLLGYKGRYKIIIKRFPLEQIHPGAKKTAIEEQCLWLNDKGCDERTRHLAAAIIDEDVQEGTALGVDATPFFLSEKGAVMREIPDLK